MRRFANVMLSLSTALLLLVSTGSVRAAGVPSHLASMAKDLLAHGGSDLHTHTGDPVKDAMNARARQILRAAGTRYWAHEPVTQRGVVSKVAEAIGLDTGNPPEWARLHDILSDPDHDSQVAKLKAWAKSQGKADSDAAFEQLVAAFDKARDEAAKDMARRHVMEVGDRHDRLELSWDPEQNRFEIRIRAGESAQGAGDGFDMRLHGEVSTRPQPGGDSANLTVRPDGQGVVVLTDAEIARLSAAIFGTWREPEGSVHPGGIWHIARGGSGQNGPGNHVAAEAIQRLEREIEQLRRDKVYRWVNADTGEVRTQDRFRRLREPWEFEGQTFRRPDAAHEIEAKEKRLADLRANNRSLPMDADDPIRMADMIARDPGSENLTLTFTDQNDYSVTYDQARLSNGRITAKRTLRSMRDIVRLPQDIIRALITSWDPPEWIELEVRIDPTSKQVSLEGKWWRMHVTYTADDHEISSIHTPYSRTLELVQGDVNVADGAAKDAKL